MEKGQAEKGKGKEAASEETKWAAPSAAGAAADLSSSWGPSRFGSAVAAPAKKKRAYETEAQIRRRKKKNRKNRERQERKAAGLKINSPNDVPTFDESDSDDRSENIDIDQPFLAMPAQLRALPNWRKRPIIRGPGIEEEYDFEAFIEYANRVKMSYDDFDALERLVAKYLPTIPLYVCTIKKSNIVKNKAKMYFSRRFTINHILPNIQLPATIKIINDLTSQSKDSAQTKQNPSQNGEQSRSRQRAYNKDIVMESMKKELKDHIDTQLALVPKRCAEEVLKMLNKNGVMYKPVEGSESNKGADEEEDDSIHIDDSSKKEFMYKTSSDNIDALISNQTKNSYKYVTPPKHNGVQEAGDKVYVTPENVSNTEGTQDNPFVINDTTKPASSSEVPDDIFARSTTKVNAGRKDDLHDGEDEVMSTDSVETKGEEATRKKGNRTKCANSNARRRNAAVQVAGKRKRMTNQKYGSPYVVAKPPPKRRSHVKKGLFAEHEVGVSSAVPTPQEIEAAALYVKTISKIPKQASKGVYKNEFGATLSSQRLNIVLAHEWLSDDVIDATIGYLSLRVGPDRMLCPAWRTNYLLELA
ncbi:hypothetical protein ACQ4PT_037871 [Festuca glaucescens]